MYCVKYRPKAVKGHDTESKNVGHAMSGIFIIFCVYVGCDPKPT